jgi:hypothetical protein
MKTIVKCDRANGDRNGDAQHREHANLGRRRRRRQIAPIIVFNVAVLQRRRRRAEIVESVDRPFVVDEFVRRRRREIREDLWPKVRRRLEPSREHGKAAARVRDVRALGISVQIRPVGSRRVGADGAAPVGGFSPHHENGAHTARLVGVRISREELAITLEGVSLDSGGVGVLGRKTGNGPALCLRE